MRIFNKFRQTKGFISTWERMIRFRDMISEQAQQRCRILTFWERHGTEATVEAFGVSRRTLYRWQKQLRDRAGKLEGLNARSTAPIKRRQRQVESWVKNRIIALKQEHPRLGKEKIHAFLRRDGYSGSISTVGRIISDLKRTGTLPESKQLYLSGKTGKVLERKKQLYRAKKRRPRGYRVLEVDTVVRFIDGVKRYTLTAIDTQSKTALAATYTNHGSASAADFLNKCYLALPNPPQAVQTDNGSEFARYFDQACDRLGLERFHTYPRSPKMNAHIERFNRTLSEHCLSRHRALMRDDVRAFNEQLMDWLVWYNTEYPHRSLGLRSPFQYMIEELQPEECQKWWTNT